MVAMAIPQHPREAVHNREKLHRAQHLGAAARLLPLPHLTAYRHLLVRPMSARSLAVLVRALTLLAASASALTLFVIELRMPEAASYLTNNARSSSNRTLILAQVA